MELNKEINIKRSTAVALLARLGLSDIPYVQSKHCRDELIRYLTTVILENTNDENQTLIVINIDDLKNHVEDYENAIKILSYYTIS